MEQVGTVAALWRYPVKSLRGERLDELELDARGVVGDRLWALADADAKLASGKTTRRFRKLLGLMHHAARLDGDTPVVTLSDGRELRVGEAAADEAIGRLLGNGWAFAREGDTPHHDEAPVHLVTNATLAHLGAATSAAVEPDRLRPNVLVDVPGETGFREDAWVARELRIGDAVLRATHRTERCVMTTHSQTGLPSRPEILKTIGRSNNAFAGIHLDVVAPAPIRVGMPVVLI